MPNLGFESVQGAPRARAIGPIMTRLVGEVEEIDPFRHAHTIIDVVSNHMVILLGAKATVDK
jgi:hypothetical protein